MSGHETPEWPAHPVGSFRWAYIPQADDWERCEVVDVRWDGATGPQLFDVRRSDGSISCGHFKGSLRDMRP